MNKCNIVALGKVLLVCCAMMLVACKKDTNRSAESIIDVGNCEKVNTVMYNDRRFIQSYSVVKLEINENSTIGDVTQLQLYDDHIYILDRVSKSMFVFNIDGTFSHKIGNRGRGPQEYLALNAFYINPDKKEITIFDPLAVRGQTFDLAGKFIANKTVSKDILPQSFSNMRYIGNDQIVCYASPNGTTEDVLFILNERDMSIEKTLVIRPIELDQATYNMAVQPYSIVDGNLHFVQWFDNNIYEYDGSKVYPIVLIDVNKPIVPQNTLKVTAENNAGDYFATVRQIADNGKYALGLQNLYETSRFIFCEFRDDSPISSLIIWDKVEKDGVFVPQPSLLMPGIKNIVYSSDDKLISYWSNNLIESYQRQLKEGRINKSEFTDDVAAVLESYEPTEDNPLLFIYDIKK